MKHSKKRFIISGILFCTTLFSLFGTEERMEGLQENHIEHVLATGGRRQKRLALNSIKGIIEKHNKGHAAMIRKVEVVNPFFLRPFLKNVFGDRWDDVVIKAQDDDTLYQKVAPFLELIKNVDDVVFPPKPNDDEERSFEKDEMRNKFKSAFSVPLGELQSIIEEAQALLESLDGTSQKAPKKHNASYVSPSSRLSTSLEKAREAYKEAARKADDPSLILMRDTWTDKIWYLGAYIQNAKAKALEVKEEAAWLNEQHSSSTVNLNADASGDQTHPTATSSTKGDAPLRVGDKGMVVDGKEEKVGYQYASIGKKVVGAGVLIALLESLRKDSWVRHKVSLLWNKMRRMVHSFKKEKTVRKEGAK